MRSYYVYLLTNKSGTLYVGVSNDLERRVYEHKHGLLRGFTTKYRLDRLVYYEETSDVSSAIEREKQIKGWVRRKKFELIQSVNPQWTDLAEEWYKQGQTLHSAQGDSVPRVEPKGGDEHVASI